MRAIRSLAGLEKLHSSMAQVATESLQPHWQPRRMPTRRVSTLGFSAAVWADARAATASIRVASRLARMVALSEGRVSETDWCAGEESRPKAGCSQDWPPHKAVNW